MAFIKEKSLKKNDGSNSFRRKFGYRDFYVGITNA
jgi:hypothetical protein